MDNLVLIGMACGVVSFLLQLYTLKNTWVYIHPKYGEITKEGKLYVPRWLVIIMFLMCIIPWANMIEFVIFCVNYAVNVGELTAEHEKDIFKNKSEYRLWKFEDNFLSKSI